MNRQAAVGTSDDTISREGSGNEEWQRRTKSNNSFDRSANSAAFIVNLRVSAIRRARLIRAFGTHGGDEMKIAIFLGLIALLTVTSLAASPKQSTFAIYLIAGSVDARVFAQEPGVWKNLPLAREPIISGADIVAYDFSKHAMRLKPEALKRLPRPSVAGTPFVVVINGERIYPGAFYTSLSSISCEIPVIVIDRAAPNQTSLSYVLLIESAYPQPSLRGKDLRSDVRVKDALANLKKLAAL
jgi:hypothetical protein